MRPELQSKDVPFPRQQVVSDVEAPHGCEVRAHDSIRNEAGHFRRRVPSAFNSVERRGPDLQPFFVLLVPLGDFCVEIPAVVIESCRFGELPDSVEVASFQFTKPYRDISHLHASVIDIVLDLDSTAEILEQTTECITERRIPQMPDVRGLVRIDRRVLDDFLFCRNRDDVAASQPCREPRGPVEKEVDVAVGRGFDSRNAIDLSERGDDFLGDGPRGFAQATGKLERERDGEIP